MLCSVINSLFPQNFCIHSIRSVQGVSNRNVDEKLYQSFTDAPGNTEIPEALNTTSLMSEPDLVIRSQFKKAEINISLKTTRVFELYS